MSKIGVLLVNLGTPNSKKPADVKKYLIEFLTDKRVINIPWLPRQYLVRRVIVPRRYKESAENYARIWDENGSPLKYYGERVKELLQEFLGEGYHVELAMRYQHPSIPLALSRMKRCSELIVLPLFPQYASATTGSVHQRVMEVLSEWTTIPETRFINSYPTQKEMIAAFCARAKENHLEEYDHYVFSFHGLPQKQIIKADLNDHCLKSEGCCSNLCSKNQSCYSAQCHATARAIAEELRIDPSMYSICFQSRLGKDPWLQPYASDTLEKLAAEGKKSLLVFSPSFVCDCLETIDEIGREYQKEFLASGGKRLDLITGLNDHPLWIEALNNLVVNQIAVPL